MTHEAKHVLQFWFGHEPFEPQNKLWWQGDEQTDQLIREHFGGLIERALAGQLDHWAKQASSAMALIILLDQLTRNTYRGTAQAFAGDQRARTICLAGLESGYLQQLHYLQCVFFCMPLEHAESLSLQSRGVDQVRQLIAQHADDSTASQRLHGYLEHAQQHHEIIQRFGRFPHRNAALDRVSTEAELAYLQEGGKRFGQ